MDQQESTDQANAALLLDERISERVRREMRSVFYNSNGPNFDPGQHISASEVIGALEGNHQFKDLIYRLAYDVAVKVASDLARQQYQRASMPIMPTTMQHPATALILPNTISSAAGLPEHRFY